MNDATITAIAAAITANANALHSLIQTLPKPDIQKLESAILQDASDPVPAPAVPVPAPAVPAIPVPVPAVPAPAVPAPAPAVPVPAVPVPAVPAPAAPFAEGGFAFPNNETLMNYVMRKYKELGPVKGGEIQGVLDTLGAKNINALRPDQYFDFFTKVEAL